jgi:hypothetical protein
LFLEIVGQETQVSLDAIYALSGLSKIHLRGSHHRQKQAVFGLAEFELCFDGGDFEFVPMVHAQTTAKTTAALRTVHFGTIVESRESQPSSLLP